MWVFGINWWNKKSSVMWIPIIKLQQHLEEGNINIQRYYN